MKLLKAALFTALFSCAGLANAELISNVPLDTSRFELMPVSELSNRAAQGNDHAQFYLAKRLQKGEGIAKNTQQAVQWYTKAAQQGVAPAQKVRNKARGKIGQLALNLSTSDIASARSKADTWFQSK